MQEVMKTKARTLTAAEFKAKCLRILETLGPEGLPGSRDEARPAHRSRDADFHRQARQVLRVSKRQDQNQGKHLLNRDQAEYSILTLAPTQTA